MNNNRSYRIFLFQKDRGVKMIAVGIGKNINENFMKEVVGTQGIVVLLKNFDSLTAKIGDILDKACGKWYNLQSVVIEAAEPRELASRFVSITVTGKLQIN